MKTRTTGCVRQLCVRLRKEAKLTKRELSDRSGLRSQTLTDLERGDFDPDMKTVEKLAAGVGRKLVFYARRKKGAISFEEATTGTLIQRCRAFQGLSQGQVAALTGIRVAIISHYECDTATPRPKRLELILKKLGFESKITAVASSASSRRKKISSG